MFLYLLFMFLLINTKAQRCAPGISEGIFSNLTIDGHTSLECDLSKCETIGRVIVFEKTPIFNSTDWTPVFEEQNHTFSQVIDTGDNLHTLNHRIKYKAFRKERILYISPLHQHDQGYWRCVVYYNRERHADSNNLQLIFRPLHKPNETKLNHNIIQNKEWVFTDNDFSSIVKFTCPIVREESGPDVTSKLNWILHTEGELRMEKQYEEGFTLLIGGFVVYLAIFCVVYRKYTIICEDVESRETMNTYGSGDINDNKHPSISNKEVEIEKHEILSECQTDRKLTDKEHIKDSESASDGKIQSSIQSSIGCRIKDRGNSRYSMPAGQDVTDQSTQTDSTQTKPTQTKSTQTDPTQTKSTQLELRQPELTQPELTQTKSTPPKVTQSESTQPECNKESGSDRDNERAIRTDCRKVLTRSAKPKCQVNLEQPPRRLYLWLLMMQGFRNMQLSIENNPLRGETGSYARQNADDADPTKVELMDLTEDNNTNIEQTVDNNRSETTYDKGEILVHQTQSKRRDHQFQHQPSSQQQ